MPRPSIFWTRIVSAAAVLTSTAAARSLRAQAPQSPAVSADASCAYDQCALGISPTWSGLAVVRGPDGPHVTNLYFLWPRDITGALRGADVHAPGADSAVAYARRAMQLRRVGAVFTDASIGLLAGAAIGAMRSEPRGHWNRALLGAAGATMAISVPLQFAADGALSRAVWWHNLRYGRR